LGRKTGGFRLPAGVSTQPSSPRRAQGGCNTIHQETNYYPTQCLFLSEADFVGNCSTNLLRLRPCASSPSAVLAISFVALQER
jgi:hypothetical protein